MSLADLFMDYNQYKVEPEEKISERDEFDEDLDEFINETFETSGNNDDIVSDNYANYLISRYKSNLEAQAAYQDKAKKIIEDYKAKVMAWAEKRVDSYNFDNERCLNLLNTYYKQNATKALQKIKLPEGTIGAYKKAQSIKIDNTALSKYYDSMEDGPEKEILAQYLAPKTSFDVTRLKNDCVVDEEARTLKLGDFEVKGASVTPSMVEFKVK